MRDFALIPILLRQLQGARCHQLYRLAHIEVHTNVISEAVLRFRNQHENDEGDDVKGDRDDGDHAKACGGCRS